MKTIQKMLWFKPAALLLAVLFAASLVLAYGLQAHGSVLPLFSSTTIPLTLLVLLGITLMLYLLLALAFAFLDRQEQSVKERDTDRRDDAFLPGGTRGRSVLSHFAVMHDKNHTSGNGTKQTVPLSHLSPLLYAGIILACWLPVLVIFFPGTVAADGYWQPEERIQIYRTQLECL